jgi:adenosylcobinamide-GDP ribazoletransferase
MRALDPLLIAVQFLTRLPLRTRAAPAPTAVGRSLLYYPLVGLLLGLLLYAAAAALARLPALLAAALVLAAWVAVTGALHLDGLADTVDAFAGGRGDRTRILAIMQDPRCGAMGAVALCLVLVLKLAALETLLARGAGPTVVAAPLLGRLALPLLFLTTPYLRAGGLGADLACHRPRRATAAVVAVWAAAIAAWGGWRGVLLLAAAVAVFVLLRRWLMSRLGGTTGDGAGALVELVETAVLVVAAVP